MLKDWLGPERASLAKLTMQVHYVFPDVPRVPGCRRFCCLHPENIAPYIVKIKILNLQSHWLSVKLLRQVSSIHLDYQEFFDESGPVTFWMGLFLQLDNAILIVQTNINAINNKN